MCLLENLNLCNYPVFLGFPGGTVVKNVCQFRRCKRQGFDPWVGKSPWSKKWQPTSVFLPRKFHGQRSLAVHGVIELDTIEWLSMHTPVFLLYHSKLLHHLSRTWNNIRDIYLCSLLLVFLIRIQNFKKFSPHNVKSLKLKIRCFKII